MSEGLLIRHCAPTLAGLKTGNMFSCRFETREEMKSTLRRINSILVRKGLRVLPLREHSGKTLLYVYRPAHLIRDLADSTACKLLKERGYCCEHPEHCIVHLIRRLSESEDFPHEIGLFLGYPPEDVTGFIENRAGGCKCVGFWKVYGDVDAARERFSQYKRCTEDYCLQWDREGGLDQLVVAS